MMHELRYDLLLKKRLQLNLTLNLCVLRNNVCRYFSSLSIQNIRSLLMFFVLMMLLSLLLQLILDCIHYVRKRLFLSRRNWQCELKRIIRRRVLINIKINSSIDVVEAHSSHSHLIINFEDVDSDAIYAMNHMSSRIALLKRILKHIKKNIIRSILSQNLTQNCLRSNYLSDSNSESIESTMSKMI